MTAHSSKIKAIFERKAQEYDDFMLKCIPDYLNLIENLIDIIPFNSNAQINICDLGSGTGNVTKQLMQVFPCANITCVDISPMMTDFAKSKLNDPTIKFEVADFNDYKFKDRYDVIVSALALHHLESNDDKKSFYKQIYDALNPGGVFYNADIVISACENSENKNMENWIEWLRNYHTEEDLMEMVINRYYEEDRPTTLANHLKWMQDIGFRNTDVIWKQKKGAVYGGYK